MTIRGFPDQKKTGSNNADGSPSAGGGQQYVTVNPVREQQNALDVLAHVYHQEIGTDAAEAGSTTTVIVATSHAALVGDAISWTSGALDTREFRVKAVAADAITVSETMSVAPSAADTFKILRPKYAEVDSDGRIDVGVTFSNDTNYGAVGANTLRTAAQIGNATGAADFNDGNSGAQTLRVVIATDQPAFTVNVGTSGLPSGAATEATLAAAAADLASIAAEDFATQTTLAAAAASLASIEAEDFATQTTLAAVLADTTAILADTDAINNSTDAIDTATAAINTKTPALGQAAMAASTPVVIASDQSSVPVTPAATNIAYQAKGKIAGTALTNSYATLLDPSTDLRIIYLLNTCNLAVFVSLDGGTTDTFELDPGESVSIDLAGNGLKFPNAVNISAKYVSAASTSGSIRATGIG